MGSVPIPEIQIIILSPQLTIEGKVHSLSGVHIVTETGFAWCHHSFCPVVIKTYLFQKSSLSAKMYSKVYLTLSWGLSRLGVFQVSVVTTSAVNVFPLWVCVCVYVCLCVCIIMAKWTPWGHFVASNYDRRGSDYFYKCGRIFVSAIVSQQCGRKSSFMTFSHTAVILSPHTISGVQLRL